MCVHGITYVQFTLDAWHFTDKTIFWRNLPFTIFAAMCYEPLLLAFLSLSTFITAEVVSFVRATVHAKVPVAYFSLDSTILTLLNFEF